MPGNVPNIYEPKWIIFRFDSLGPRDDINVILTRNLGLEPCGNGFFVDVDYAAKKPKEVQGFVRATLKGWQNSFDDQKGAIAILMKRKNILNDGQEFVRLKIAIDKNVLTPEVLANGLAA